MDPNLCLNQNDFAEAVFNNVPTLIRLHRWWQKNVVSCADFAHSPMQSHALMAIRQYAPLNMTQLADHLMIPRQQLTNVINVLVNRGLVLREINPQNRRNILLRLSGEGEEELKDMLYHTYCAIERISHVFTEQQWGEMAAAFQKIHDILNSVEIA